MTGNELLQLVSQATRVTATDWTRCPGHEPFPVTKAEIERAISEEMALGRKEFVASWADHSGGTLNVEVD